jgi:glucose-6-phosphate 1-dehydrogenase
MTSSPVGGAGDLSFRKLLPALYMAHAHGKLEADTRIIGIGRQSWNREQYLDFINEQSPPFIEANAFKQDDWQTFLRRLQFVQLDLTSAGDYAKLKAVCHEPRMRVFY